MKESYDIFPKANTGGYTETYKHKPILHKGERIITPRQNRMIGTTRMQVFDRELTSKELKALYTFNRPTIFRRFRDWSLSLLRALFSKIK